MGKKARIIQVFNPIIRQWVKMDRYTGKITAHKKTPGPWPGVTRYHHRKPKAIA